MKGDLYAFISTEIKRRVSEIRKVDLNRGQLDQSSEVGLFPYALVDFGETQYKDDGQGAQQGICKVRVSVVQQDNALNVQSDIADEVVTRLLNFPNQIYLALQDKSGGGNSSFEFTRAVEGDVIVQDDLLIYPIEFNVTLYDYSKRQEYISGREIPPNTEMDIM
ncbi:MAG: hypothetical protein AAFX87_02815 [Bacteroidota bacterium]